MKNIHPTQTILDACCGTRQMWYDKHNPNAVYMDKFPRAFADGMGRTLTCDPDIVGDFRNMPFDDNSFDLVVWDPPHISRAGQGHWIANKYGCADKETWETDLKSGFTECMRVLRPGGTLIFKWSDSELKIRKVLEIIGQNPVIGDRGKGPNCIWCIFYKTREASAK